MRLLVTGAAGLLGRELLRTGTHEVVPTYHSQEMPGGVQLDVRRRDAVRDVIRSVRPDGIIHTAYRQDDWATTADGAVNVALAAEGVRLVFVSSDAVFGPRETPYAEHESPCPITAYGAAKAAAETAIRAITPEAIIARTSLIVGSDGHSEEERRVRRLAAGEPGAFYTHNIRCPVHVNDLATALLELLMSDVIGVTHVAGPEALSRLDLGRLIAVRDGLDPQALPFTPGTPSDIRLDCSRTQEALKTRLRPASEFLLP
ncbi:SDR family oxidoreductase [Kribbella sindirgiensis]|uniref:NAD-dependent epimerase/dehydratase family protein n=1 Tax=Kribbella sindirgiensis TaxID=1124744 RepID=A0A4R0IAB5_9ACTN|nr:sugar nucleotide-binding protein [Kribbella sindirgiensis]TCC26119.1 NAD-dependent epimerase/dehydratase family protein [Kribbella sindirgiensis]